MLKKIFLCVLFCVAIFGGSQQASATSRSVVIYQVFSGVDNAAQEFVALYNNSDTEADITGWCLTNKSGSQFACPATDPNSEIVIGARQFFIIASVSIASQADFTVPDANNITGSSDTINLVNGAQVIDTVAWTTDLGTGNAMQRKMTTPGVVLDTGLLTDFEKRLNPLRVQNIDLCLNIPGVQNFKPEGMIIDANSYCIVPPPVDVCLNVDGYQATVPVGLTPDGMGNCYVDVCSDIEGLQLTIPPGYDPAPGNSCVLHDECPNLPDAQLIMPLNYVMKDGSCVLDLLPLQITELLPNSAGTDTGKEYIELYNPTDKAADLSLYKLHVGLNNEKTFEFPLGSIIGPGEYKTFYDSEIKFTLANTTSKVSVTGNDGTSITQTEIYSSPDDDQAWAYINGIWEYTNQPTPGGFNLAFLETTEDPVSNDTTVATCPVGKYRNPLTNRCRNIESDASVLASCDADQYRNPDTGRCRKITVAATLAACKEGQYRSEETNRCRNIETAGAQLAACKEGQERNPDTNRCRTIAAASIPSAAYAVQPVKDGVQSFVGWAALGGVGVLALGYAGWEWRREIAEKIKGIGSLFSSNK